MCVCTELKLINRKISVWVSKYDTDLERSESFSPFFLQFLLLFIFLKEKKKKWLQFVLVIDRERRWDEIRYHVTIFNSRLERNLYQNPTQLEKKYMLSLLHSTYLNKSFFCIILPRSKVNIYIYTYIYTYNDFESHLDICVQKGLFSWEACCWNFVI